MIDLNQIGDDKVFENRAAKTTLGIQSFIFYTFLALITLTASTYVLFCIKYAPWGYSDSAVYFSAARNLAKGVGLGTINPDGSFLLLTHFSPGYPLLLSLFALFKVNLILASQITDVLFYGLFVFFNGYLLFKITNSKVLALSLAVMSASSISLVKDFTSMMSEPLGLTTGVIGFLLVILYIKQNQPQYLYISGVLCAIAFAARYALLAFPLAGLITLAIFLKVHVKAKLATLAKYASISIGPMALWGVYQITASKEIGSRHMLSINDLPARFTAAMKNTFTVIKFWLPYRSNMIPGLSADYLRPVLLVGFIVLVLLGFVFATIRRTPDNPVRQTVLIASGALILAGCYLVVFYFSYFFVSAVGLDDRLLSPLIPAIFLYLIGSAFAIQKGIGRLWVGWIVGFILAVMYFGYNYLELRKYVIISSNYPSGYASPVWKDDNIFSKIQQLPEKVPTISNAPDISLFYTDRFGYYLSANEINNPDKVAYSGSLSFNQLKNDQCAILILFNPVDANAYEKRPNPINTKAYSELINTSDIFFSDNLGVILRSRNCPNITLN